jgi:hypothetical protein
MFYLSDETAIKIHTAPDGNIWHAAGLNLPENSNQTLDTFLLSNLISKLSTNVRVIGVPQNAELIANLYLRKRSKELATICIAGPNVCESMEELKDPVTTIFRMRDVILPLSCGGWHEMTPVEYAVYALLARKQRTADWFDSGSRLFYEAHPLYKLLSFIPGVSHKDAADLITTIIDPRWYVDRRRADNAVKLALYLGLTPKIQRRVSDVKQLLRRGRDLRCNIVLRCWKTQSPDAVDFNSPQNFLWRIWRSAGEGSKGDLRASQAFVRYLYANWLDVLTARRGPRDGFFMLDRFFQSPAEREAFADHFA